jgi:hypothetical protein
MDGASGKRKSRREGWAGEVLEHSCEWRIGLRDRRPASPHSRTVGL